VVHVLTAVDEPGDLPVRRSERVELRIELGPQCCEWQCAQVRSRRSASATPESGSRPAAGHG
jgi:hypothetical protein